MPQLAGTSNVDVLNAATGINSAGTFGVAGNSIFAGNVTSAGTATFNGPITFNGTVTNSSGGLQAGTLYAAAGTVTLVSGYVVFNAAVAGFAVRLPAPQAGAELRIINQVAASSGSNTITIPSGGTIYQGTVSGSVLTFGTVGQVQTLLGISSTQYHALSLGTMIPVLS